MPVTEVTAVAQMSAEAELRPEAPTGIEVVPPQEDLLVQMLLRETVPLGRAEVRVRFHDIMAVRGLINHIGTIRRQEAPIEEGTLAVFVLAGEAPIEATFPGDLLILVQEVLVREVRGSEVPEGAALHVVLATEVAEEVPGVLAALEVQEEVPEVREVSEALVVEDHRVEQDLEAAVAEEDLKARQSQFFSKLI